MKSIGFFSKVTASGVAVRKSELGAELLSSGSGGLRSCALTGGRRWYVAETLSRSEKLAQYHLERQGFTCFCPRFRATRRHARRTTTTLTPLFPGYIFVSFSRDHDRWQSINSTIGARRLVGGERGPVPMPLEVMEALFARCGEGEVDCVIPDVKPGDQVRITSGPFANCVAAIEALDGKGRVRVLLDILGSCKSLTVEKRAIGPV